MIKLKKYTALLLCAFVLGGPIAASADEFDQKIQSQNQKIEQLEQTEQSEKAQKQSLEENVATIQAAVTTALNEKAQEEKRLSELTAKIQVLQEKIEKRELQLKKQARNVQTSQTASTVVHAVIDSESVGDAVKKTMAITSVMKANRETMEQQTQDKTELQTLEKEAQQKLASINQKTTELKSKQDSLVKAKLDQEVKINALQASIATEKNQKEKFEKQKEEAEKKRQAALKALAEQQKKEAQAREKAQKEAERLAKLAAEQAKLQAEQAAREQAAAQAKAQAAETVRQQEAARQAKIAAEEQAQQAQKQAEQAKLQEQQAATVTDATATQTPVVSTDTNTSATTASTETQNDTPQTTQPETQAPTTTNGWTSPLASLIVTSPFGWRENPTMAGGQEHHDGIDFAGAAGTPIYAAKTGTVVEAGFHYSAGNHVVIQHADGHYSYYMHMISTPSVAVGQQVTAGQTVGAMGTTGNSTGVHLHFGVSTALWSSFVDPAPLLGV